MFRSAIIKLTIMYLGILVILCIFFSANWYAIASRELDRSLRRQDEWLQVNPRALGGSLMNEFLTIRSEQLQHSKQAVMFRIFMSDLGLILIGGVGCYYLARKTLEPIEEAHEAQVRFTSDASHELRTPLAVIKTETEVTLRDTKLTKEMAIQQLKSNLDEVSRLQTLTENLLLLARSGNDEPISKQSVNLTDLLGTVAKQNKALADQNSIRIKMNVSNDASSVYTNADLLSSILGILLDNAIKYSPPKSVVSLSSTRLDKKHIKIDVTDEGPGIPKAAQKKVFDRFYRLDNSRTKQQVDGHGLGLAIATELAKRIDASLALESKLKKGSTFSVIVQSLG